MSKSTLIKTSMNIPKSLLIAAIALGTPACKDNEQVSPEIATIISDVILEKDIAVKTMPTPATPINIDLIDNIPPYVEGFDEAGNLAKKWFPIARFGFQKFIEKQQAEAKVILSKQSKTDGSNASVALSAFVETVDNPTFHYSDEGRSVDIQFFGSTDGSAFKDYLFDRIVAMPLAEKRAKITIDDENTYLFDVYKFNNVDGSNGYTVSTGFAQGNETTETMETLIFYNTADGYNVTTYCNEMMRSTCTNSNDMNNDGSSKLNIPKHMELVDNLF